MSGVHSEIFDNKLFFIILDISGIGRRAQDFGMIVRNITTGTLWPLTECNKIEHFGLKSSERSKTINLPKVHVVSVYIFSAFHILEIAHFKYRKRRVVFLI